MLIFITLRYCCFDVYMYCT